MASLRRARSCALSVLLLGAVALTWSGSAQATWLTGIADENVATWSPTAVWWSTSLGHVRQMRHITRWDVAQLPTTHPARQATQNWLDSVRSLGKRPLISFGPACGKGAPPCTGPTLDQYEEAVATFRSTFRDVTEFTAWNEPNHHLLSSTGTENNPTANDAQLAAQFWNALDRICGTGATCTVAAGDMLDGDPAGTGFDTYLTTYKNALSRSPSVWALHPYSAINSNNDTKIRSFLAATGGAPVWFTEAGAFYCQPGATEPIGGTPVWGAAVQRNAMWTLRNFALTYAARVQRVYYYHHARSAGVTRACANGWDSGLLGSGDVERAALRIARNGAPIPMLFKDGTWRQRFSYDTANDPNRVVAWGQPGDQPVFGDWDGDGVTTPGIFRNGTWWLTNDPLALDGSRALVFSYGGAGDTAVAGDWNGDGIDTVGVRQGNTFHLSNTNASGPTAYHFSFGDPGNAVVVGNWDGDRGGPYGAGSDGIAIVVGDAWYVKNNLSGSAADTGWFYGGPGDKPVAGDWDGDGQDDPGVFRNIGGRGAWFLGKQGQSANLTGFWSYFADGSETPLTG
ncbi:hypothetical protein VSS74_04775 [Conexibacter stalactiti]|uniref:Asl1-like glycosyl hydrolase catalytic domain-containing protein n=1 Tax=Conexibacter stalactiti TaxID=1940611 RepID=A0ABU4HK40_9ACTN|nr:hypothetical protein [Conexibacter stalactiti]MDW5593637.1 hypothetical protein [Conexibacter stalactiti]MEC5034278.1 hypothetical protein [Conexibacter stalactiti]